MTDKTSHIFDNPANIKRVLHGLYISCGILLLLDFVIHRHVEHSWESLWGFYPLYGFVGCVVLVIIAKWMRTALMRDQHYYQGKTLDTKQDKPAGKALEDDHVGS